MGGTSHTKISKKVVFSIFVHLTIFELLTLRLGVRW
jgi:hypothetical protein